MNKFEIRCNVIIGALCVLQNHDLFIRGYRKYDVTAEDMRWAKHIQKDLAPKVKEIDKGIYPWAQNLAAGNIW